MSDVDDGLTPEVVEVRERVRQFIDDEVIPAEDVLEEGGSGAYLTIEGLKAEAKRRGLWALGHPEEIGGGGLPFMSFVHLNEVIGRSQYGQVCVGSWSMQDSIMLQTFGTPAQQEEWLAPLVAGEIRSSIGMTEPEVAGSDPTLFEATGTLDGEEWVVNAHKWFTTGANIAAFTTIFCRTEPGEDNPYKRISAIIVPTDTPGWELVRVIPTMGHAGGSHCEILLTDCRVPAANLLGGRGEGFTISQKRLGPGRIFHAMRWLGQAQRAFELMVARANTRFSHGSLLAEKGEIQRMIFDSVADIQSHRLLVLDAARVLDQGGDARVEISIAKVRGAKMLHDVIDRAIQVHGALGVTSDLPLERMYREARYARIYDGPDEVHRQTVARRILRGQSAPPWARS
jgi:acyl-CoA dehydrogenase